MSENEMTESLERAYSVIMEFEGAVQVAPIDEAMRSRLERLKEQEEHHQEHHDREEQMLKKHMEEVSQLIPFVAALADKTCEAKWYECDINRDPTCWPCKAKAMLSNMSYKLHKEDDPARPVLPKPPEDNYKR